MAKRGTRRNKVDKERLIGAIKSRNLSLEQVSIGCGYQQCYLKNITRPANNDLMIPEQLKMILEIKYNIPYEEIAPIKVESQYGEEASINEEQDSLVANDEVLIPILDEIKKCQSSFERLEVIEDIYPLTMEINERLKKGVSEVSLITSFIRHEEDFICKKIKEETRELQAGFQLIGETLENTNVLLQSLIDIQNKPKVKPQAYLTEPSKKGIYGKAK